MSAMARILLIDDDTDLGPPLAAYFRRFGLELVQAFAPSKGLACCVPAASMLPFST